jgi:hypothetical protein
MYPPLETTLPLLLAETWKSAAMFGGTGWVQFEQGQFYLRIGPRIITPDSVLLCVCIANVKMREEHEKTGIFTRAVKAVREITKWPIFLENVRQDVGVALTGCYGWQVVPSLAHKLGKQTDLVLYGSGERTSPKVA